MLASRSRSARWVISGLFFVLLVGALAALPGDAPAIAQRAPHIDEAVSEMEAVPGFFNMYRTEDGALFMEVTEEHFGKDFLVVVQMARGVGESILLTGYPLATDMLTFRMRNDRIELVTRNPYFRADPGTPLARMVDLGFRESVRQTFGIVARDDGAGRYLINVTGLFLSDWPDLADFLPLIYGVGFGFDPRRSTLVSVEGFPENVEIEVDLTFAAPRPIPSQTLPDPKTLPISYHYSILELPETPMKPRRADDRVGYFVTAYRDYSHEGSATNAVRLVNRWRLEKKDPYALLSEPVKPIVFYLEETIPEAYRPYIKEGIEAWNKAFEAAGFKNAIVALDQPDDPNWDPGDARYSTIRWMPSVDSIFAAGPSDVDPRSGEILNSDILFTSDWVRALTGEHELLASDDPMGFLERQAKALELARLINPEFASRLCTYSAGLVPHLALLRYTLMADGVIGPDGDVPLEYVGAALRETTMHEVGHALGLRHNFKASSVVPNRKLHDTSYTEQFGITSSVMEYNPPNINPERSEQGEYFNSTVGPYDVWAVQWGYLPVGNETLAPHPQLEAIAEERHEPEHAYGTDEDAWAYPYALDPTINQWDLGSDPIAYYRGLQRLVARLWPVVEQRVIEEGEPFWPLRNAVTTLLFEKVIGHFYAAPKAIGGLYVTRAHKGDPRGENPLSVVPAAEQRRALEFLLEAFTPQLLEDFPKELLDKAIPERCIDWACTWPFGTRFTYPIHNVVMSIRTQLLEMAFWPERLMRIRDNAYRSNETDPFTLDELFGGFTDTIWAGVLGGRAPSDSFQRAIQSVYLDKLIALATDGAEEQSRPRIDDARALAFSELMRIDQAIDRALASGTLAPVDRAHLLRARHRIEKALNVD